MNKKWKYVIHAAIWAVLWLSPLYFLNHGNGVSLMQYLMSCTGTVFMMIVFYINYFLLTPKYFLAGNKRFYWIINILMCIIGGFIVHLVMLHAHNWIDFANGRDYPTPTWIQHAAFIFRNIFNLSVAAASATLILLATKWHYAEEARILAEAARTDAELSNLRSQINPHFLLNTLNNIYALTAIDSTKAQETIQQLSSLLRHVLYDYQLPKVPLADEIEFLKNYVELMKIRLPETVTVSFDTEISNSNIHQIAPLLFISLVENAFKHGVSPTEPSFIKISIMADESQIVCNISNSNNPKNQEDRSGHGIGLCQVQRRLDLSYAGHYQWTKGISPDRKTYQSKIIITP